MKVEKYHLYVATFTPATAKIALDEAYSKVTRTHILIYKKGKCPEGYKEITERDMYMLPTVDVRWVHELNMELIKQFIHRNEEANERAGKKFLHEFEKELQIESEKIQGSGAE